MGRTRADVLFERFRRSGDPRALGRVFDLTAVELFKVATYLCNDRHGAEDLLQSTFLTAIEDAQSFEPGRAVLPWLLGILANRSRMTRRTDGRREERERRQTPATGDPVAEAETRELRESLDRALRELPEPYRHVLFLHLEHGLSARAIAESLSRPAGTVRTQIVRGMELLRNALPVGLAGTLIVAAPARAFPLVRAAVLESLGPAAPAAVSSSLLVGSLLLMKKSVAVFAVLLLAGLGVFGKLMVPALPEAASGGGIAASASDAPATRPFVREPGRGVEGGASRRALDTARPRAPLAPGKAGLLVRVRWGDDHEPAVGLLVYAVPGAAGDDRDLHVVRTRSSATGEARFANLAPGRLGVEADRGGKAALELAAGTWHELDLEIPAGVTVTGTVVDAGGKTFAGARIWASSPTREVTRGVELATSDAAGRFHIRSVQPGRYLSALAPGRLPQSGRPVPKDARDSVELTLEVGGKAATVRGTVFGPDGRPLPDASVAIGHVTFEMGPSMPVVCLVRTDERGEFVADGVFREQRVAVSVRAPACAIWKQDVSVSESKETFVAAHLRRGATIDGTVRDALGAPVAGARVSAFQDEIEPHGHVMFSGPAWARPSVNTDRAGCFTLQNLLPGSVRLRAETKKEWAVRSFELADGGVSTWDAVLGSGLSILGTVVDTKGAPLAGWSVGARGGRGVRLTVDTETRPDGTFELPGCEDTVYSVVARDGNSAMHSTAVTLNDVRPGGEPARIVVPADQMSTCSVTGIVLDPEGKPVRNKSLYVRLSRIGEEGSVTPAGSAAKFEGDHFVVGPVRPGTYDVSAFLQDVGTLRLGTHRLEPGQTLDVGSVRSQAPGFVRLTVKDLEGQPLASGSFPMQPVDDRLGSGDILHVAAGTARSKPLQPGTYEVRTWVPGPLALCSRTVEVRSGQETSIAITLPRGVLRKIRFPGVKTEETVITQIWRNESGETLVCSTSMFSNVSGPHTLEQRLVPGTYHVEVQDVLGHAAKTTFVIDEREDSDQVLDLRLPAEVCR